MSRQQASSFGVKRPSQYVPHTPSFQEVQPANNVVITPVKDTPAKVVDDDDIFSIQVGQEVIPVKAKPVLPPPSRPTNTTGSGGKIFVRQGQGSTSAGLTIRQTKAGGKFKDKEDAF